MKIGSIVYIEPHYYMNKLKHKRGFAVLLGDKSLDYDHEVRGVVWSVRFSSGEIQDFHRSYLQLICE